MRTLSCNNVFHADCCLQGKIKISKSPPFQFQSCCLFTGFSVPPFTALLVWFHVKGQRTGLGSLVTLLWIRENAYWVEAIRCKQTPTVYPFCISCLKARTEHSEKCMVWIINLLCGFLVFPEQADSITTAALDCSKQVSHHNL